MSHLFSNILLPINQENYTKYMYILLFGLILDFDSRWNGTAMSMTIRMIRIINWMPMLGWRCRCGVSNGRIFGNGTAIFCDWIGRNDYWNTIVVHATSKCIACSRILRVRQFYNYEKKGPLGYVTRGSCSNMNQNMGIWNVLKY